MIEYTAGGMSRSRLPDRHDTILPENSVVPPHAGDPSQRRRDPVGMRPNIRAVKDAVGIERVAADYGSFRLSGASRLQGRCVSPHHEDRTPSMTIYAAEGRFKCFGCGEHGDVIDLVVLAEGCKLWEALVLLGNRYGVELPGRPDSWHRKLERQAPVRDIIARARFEHQKRRLFRVFFKPALMLIEDPEEREIEYGFLMEAADYLTRMMRDRLMERGRS